MNPFLHMRETGAQRGKATCPRMLSWSGRSGPDSTSDCTACFPAKAFITELAAGLLCGWKGQQVGAQGLEMSSIMHRG